MLPYSVKHKKFNTFDHLLPLWELDNVLYWAEIENIKKYLKEKNMQENKYKIAVTKRQLIRDSEFYELLDNFIDMSDLEKSIHLLEDAIKYADSYSMYFEHMDYYKTINLIIKR